MWTLRIPDVSGVENDLKDAVTYKIDRPPKYEYSDEQILAIVEMYRTYDADLGRPSDALKAHHLGEEILNVLHDSYGEVQDTGRLKALRDRLKVGPSSCPMCGFGPIQDLDHHLPKSVYKAFSIYPRNLIPSCSTCNKKKYTVAAGEPERHFLHVYLESLPEEEFFIASVTLPPAPAGLVVDFSVIRSASMTEEMWKRLSFQVNRLDLSSRYGKETTTLLASLEVSLLDAYGQGESGEGVRAFLVRSADSYVTRFGRNDWRTALLRGLARSDAFCNGGFVRVLGHMQPGG